MKYRILTDFQDYYTGEIYRTGDIVEFSKARAEEITEISNGTFIAKETRHFDEVEENEKTKETKRK